MFDFSNDDGQWDDEPDWEDFFVLWVNYLSKCAEYHGLVLVDNKLVLPKGQSNASHGYLSGTRD